MTSVGQPASSNNWRLSLATAVLALAFVSSMPATAHAQSSIAGVVTDTSGAVLPGVTVEASSPALIEKVRSAVTDGGGVYRIVDLRPGTYIVTFTLPGFVVVKRDGVVLPASFTATVNAEMRVGGVEETITVSGEAPLVDVQSTAQTTTLSQEILEAVPTATQRMPSAYTFMLPGVTGGVGTGSQAGLGNSTGALAIHGSRGGEHNTHIDGISTGDMGTGGTSFYYYLNQATVQEVAVTTGSGNAEQQYGGVMTDTIPKDGGNRFNGTLYYHYANEDFVGSNVTPELRAKGVQSSLNVRKMWDFNPAVGGPLKQDRLWFFASYRDWGSALNMPTRYNLTPNGWSYEPDLSRRVAENKVSDRNHSLRLTFQATPRNKFTAFYDYQPHYIWNRDLTAVVSPEATTYSPIIPNSLTQLGWRSPVNNRVLLEAGTNYQNGTLWQHKQTRDEGLLAGPTWNPDNVSVQELTTGMRYRAAARYGNFGTGKNIKARVAMSYVTGSHSFKVGWQIKRGQELVDAYRNGDVHYGFRAGAPVRITQFTPEFRLDHLNADMGLFAQDQWTMANFTINAGVRYDYFNANIPEQNAPGNQFIAARHFDPVNRVPLWHDISPRLGVSWDPFGTGKTAVKGSLNRYVNSQAGPIADANPLRTTVLSTNRNWTDTNGNFHPDCNLQTPAANGECGVIQNLLFGQNNPNARRTDPALLDGFGIRGYNWETSLGVQHELVPGLSTEISYHRRWYGNFTAIDNLLVTPADFDPFCVTLPRHQSLPNGGGSQQCGYMDVKPAKLGQVQELVTEAEKFGGQRSEVFDGVDLTTSARLRNGVQFSGGVSIGRIAIDTCQVIDTPLALAFPAALIAAAPAEFCDYRPPFQANIKFLGVYPLPWYGIQASASIISIPGPEILAIYTATNAEIAPSLGRNLASGANGTVDIPLIPGGTFYGERFTKVDARLTKVFRVGVTRLQGSLDIVNLLNSSTAQLVNTTFGPNWLQPTQIPGARMFRLAAQFDF